MMKYKAEDERSSHRSLEYKHFKPPEFIVTNFRILNGMYSLLLRNRSHAEVFGRLREYGRLLIQMQFERIKRDSEFVNETQKNPHGVLPRP